MGFKLSMGKRKYNIVKQEGKTLKDMEKEKENTIIVIILGNSNRKKSKKRTWRRETITERF